MKGSITAVVGSGITSMSEAWISAQPRMDEPSKPSPSSKISSFSSCERDGEVLPQPDEVHELEVHHHRAAVLGEPQDVLWFHAPSWRHSLKRVLADKAPDRGKSGMGLGSPAAKPVRTWSGPLH